MTQVIMLPSDPQMKSPHRQTNAHLPPSPAEQQQHGLSAQNLMNTRHESPASQTKLRQNVP